MARRSKMIQNISIDRLSDLPEGILHHILSFLDTKSFVQTNVLSSRWISPWKHVPVLTFDQSSFESLSVFELYVKKVISNRSDESSVRTVTVNFSVRHKDTLDEIMKYAALEGVREIFPYKYRCNTLTGSVGVGLVFSRFRSLKIVELNQAHLGKSDIRLWSRLQLLESLTLTNCSLAFARANAFTNFPRLETLKLLRCFCVEGYFETSVLKVTGPNLLNLELVSPLFFGVLQINAPRLQYFGLTVDHLCCNIRPNMSRSNLPSLNRANIKLSGNNRTNLEGYSADNPAMKQQQLEKCVDLFKILHNLQALNLQVANLELLIETCNSEKHQSPPFKRLESLNLKCAEGRCIEVPDKVTRYFFGGSPN